jgi:molecular chaperone GrpE
MTEDTQIPENAPTPRETPPAHGETPAEAAGAVPGGEAAPQPAPDPEVRVRELEAKNAELQDAWLRARAETENVRRRAQEEVARAHKFGIEKFASGLLAVKDSLEAALAREEQSVEDLRGGVELTLKQLVAVFEKSAIREIDPAGEKFDPHLHQAIQTTPSDLEPNTVTQVLQKGYSIAERVLRPAMVIVAKERDAAA